MRLPMHLKTIPIGVAVIAVSFLISLTAMDRLWPRAGSTAAPVLAELPPLPLASRSSSVGAGLDRAECDPRRSQLAV